MNQTGFMLYSDRIRMMFPTYLLDSVNRVIPGPETPTANFNHIMSVLLSKDLSRNEEISWIEKERNRFLDKSVSMRNHGIAFCSYPRSGNTMLRVYLEQITGITTGANDQLTGGALSLQISGLKGEAHLTDHDTVWITKVHPIGMIIPTPPFTVTKQIYLIRNPIDMIVSEFLLYTAKTHSSQVSEDLKNNPGFKKWFDLALPRIKVMQRNIMDNKDQGMPTLFLTYEMLILEPEQTLTDIFRFFLGVPSLEGTVVEKRIKDVCAEGHEKKAIYELKTTKQKENLSRNSHCYSDDDIAMIK